MDQRGYGLLAALSGCAGGRPSPEDVRSQTNRAIYHTEQTAALPSGEKAFGSGFDANWRSLGGPETAVASPGSDARSSLTPEEREFQDWRAWQEWKRRNPK